MEKALYLMRGGITDLSDILRIARTEGRKILNVQKVNVKPVVVPYNNGYLVVVSPEHNGVGCSKAPNVGGKRKEKK